MCWYKLPEELRKEVRMNDVQKRPLSRWFLLLWIVAVYLIELWWGAEFLKRIRLDLFAFLVIFTALHLSLCWVSLTPKSRRLWLVCCFAGQVMIILLIAFLLRSVTPLVTILYLILIEEVIMVLQRRPSAAAIAAGCLLLLPLGASLSLRSAGIWLPGSFLPRGGSDSTWSLLLLLFFLVIPLIPFVVGYLQAYARERDQSFLRQLEAAHTQLADYALRVEDLTLITERQRLARELHDTLAQGLAGVILQLEVANSHLKQDHSKRGQEIVQQAIVRARTALIDARSAIEDLRVGAPDPDDLPEAVQEKVEHFTTTTSIPCDLELAALASTPASLCEHVLRVISEALENVAHHAQAQHVCIRALIEQATLTVEIRDDGCGFDPAAVARQAGHYGLLGLRERARLIGGRLEVVSAPGKGTVLRLCLPMCSPHQSNVPTSMHLEETDTKPGSPGVMQI
jgi:NarL family two-component system sensor histidine kinase YdfH